MRSPAWVLAIVAGLLGIVAAAVLGGGDGRVLVSPPETVAEGFLHALQTRRYEQARQHLTFELRARTPHGELRSLHGAMEARWGRIEKVGGERAPVPDAAVGLLRASNGNARLTLLFRREHGEWRLRELNALR
jgi:hypothetical protein